jgi:hypothetical protein
MDHDLLVVVSRELDVALRSWMRPPHGTLRIRSCRKGAKPGDGVAAQDLCRGPGRPASHRGQDGGIAVTACAGSRLRQCATVSGADCVIDLFRLAVGLWHDWILKS